MLKLTLSIAIFWTFGHSLLANEIVEKPAVLFQMLKSNEHWTSVAKKGEVILSTKSIKNMSLVAFMAIKILNVGFFAKQDPKTPMYVALASLIINVILNWFFAFQLGLGHVGLAIGSVFAAIISFFVL